MGNHYFKFKQFTIHQQYTAMKVGVDAVLLGAWSNPDKAKSILDIGTGTGLLSLMLAQKSEARIVAIEIDEDSYHQAVTNIKASNWADRIEVYRTSLQEFALRETIKFDFIVCNPPFFNSSLLPPDNKRTLARHDLTLGLNDLFLSANLFLDLNGRFTMIYLFERKEELITIAAENKLFPSKILHVKGNEKKEPNRVIFEFGKEPVVCEENEIAIRNSDTQQYTNEYKYMTRDYYLNF